MLGSRYDAVRNYRAALSSLCFANELLHVSAAVKDIKGGALSSLAYRTTLSELNENIRLISGLSPDLIARLSESFSFTGAIQKLDPICQPLLRSGDYPEIVVPRAYSSSANWERNILKLFAKDPRTTAEYNIFSSTKESIALGTLEPEISKQGVTVCRNVPISQDGRQITDVDLLLYDKRDRFILVTQHKWLIEPDTANESKACDGELQKGIDQARLAKKFLSDFDRLRQFLPDLPPEGFSAIEGLVVCRGLEPTGFLRETDVPVVTERWFRENLASSGSLGKLFTHAKDRPDRRELARGWKAESHGVEIGGYHLLIPAMVTTAEEGKPK